MHYNEFGFLQLIQSYWFFLCLWILVLGLVFTHLLMHLSEINYLFILPVHRWSFLIHLLNTNSMCKRTLNMNCCLAFGFGGRYANRDGQYMKVVLFWKLEVKTGVSYLLNIFIVYCCFFVTIFSFCLQIGLKQIQFFIWSSTLSSLFWPNGKKISQ